MRDHHDLTRRQIRRIRQAAGAQPNDAMKIQIYPGIMMAPRVTGRPWSWSTRGGGVIQYPSAYSRVGWSNMVYHPSTRRIVVGADWIQAVCQRAQAEVV